MKLCYIANINSPHVGEWLEALDGRSALAFATIEDTIDGEKIGKAKISIDEIIRPPRIFRFLPKQLRYIILGIQLRLKNKETYAFHAHNASGYGLTAALSGKPYLLTTYGSEVFHSQTKSNLYNYLVQFALQRAVKLTATTKAMQAYLEKHFSVPPNKIDVFSLGVSNAFFYTHPRAKSFDTTQGPVWFSNRRILPLYRTLEIVKAFISFKSNGGKGSLILLQGDAEGEYFDQVISHIASRSDIRLVRGFVDTDTIINLLDEAHFTISIPKTDQLSSSILEAMARKCIPILADLEAYKVLEDCSIKLVNSDGIQVQLEKVFHVTSTFTLSQYMELTNQCFETVTSNYNRASLAKKYHINLSILGVKE